MITILKMIKNVLYVKYTQPVMSHICFLGVNSSNMKDFFTALYDDQSAETVKDVRFITEDETCAAGK